MRIGCMSDTHHRFASVEVPAVDMLLHAGDCQYDGTFYEWCEFIDWFGKQPAQYKILVPGNHDFYLQNELASAKEQATAHGVTILVDETVVIDGIKIYGTPWCPNLRYWAFYANDYELIDKAKAIPQDTDIVLTHSPAYGILDRVRGESVGWATLRKRIEEITPKLHVCGHIHEGYGGRVIDKTYHINASICNEFYRPTNKVIIVELPNDNQTISGGR